MSSRRPFCSFSAQLLGWDTGFSTLIAQNRQTVTCVKRADTPCTQEVSTYKQGMTAVSQDRIRTGVIMSLCYVCEHVLVPVASTETSDTGDHSWMLGLGIDRSVLDKFSIDVDVTLIRRDLAPYEFWSPEVSYCFHNTRSFQTRTRMWTASPLNRIF